MSNKTNEVIQIMQLTYMIHLWQKQILINAGFYHEQSRRDRDDYITIDFTNVIPAFRKNFKKYQIGWAETYELPYDTSSVMHYGSYAFAKNRSKPTIVLKNKTPNVILGRRNGFSSLDIKAINSMYKCSGSGVTGASGGGSKAPGNGTSSACKDEHAKCVDQAIRGLCNSKSDFVKNYMKKNCKESCKLC